MNRIGSIFVRHVDVACLLALGLILCAIAEIASAQSVWELTPYRIRLIVAAEPTATLNPELTAKLQTSLLERIETVVGVRWEVEPAEPSPRLRHRMTDDLESVQFEDLPKDVTKFDKVFLVAIVPKTSGHEVVARELDVRTRVFSPVVRRPVWQPAKLRDVVFESLLDIFTPLARVAKTVQKEVTLRLRAAGLPPRDPSLRRIQKGDVFQPLMVYSDRQGNFRKRIDIPWTFLVVEQYDDKGILCKLLSAMTSPMSGRRRGRVEALALAVRPSGGTTRLVIKGRVEPKPLLADYRINERELDSPKTTFVGRTDVDGAIEIGPGERPVRLLYVRSGKVDLAKLPVVPGLYPELTAEIRDDDQRLEAEGFISAMQLNLIDLVMRRKILIQRCENCLQAGEIDKAQKIVEELQGLPTQGSMLRELKNAQDRIIVEDKWSQKKVNELFDDTRKLLYKHLADKPNKDEKSIKELAHEVTIAARENKTPKKKPKKTP